LDVNLSDENIARVAAQKAFLLKHGFIKTDFELKQWIDPNPLQAAHALVKERRQSGLAAASQPASSVQVGPAGCASRAVPGDYPLPPR
jgi:hypothetical protein